MERAGIHDVKPRGYSIRLRTTSVSVEHRASFRPRTIVVLSIIYIGYCSMPAVRKILVDFYQHRDPVVAGFAVFMLSIPFFCGVTWLMFQSGEVFRCDAEMLHIAQRRTLGRWHKKALKQDGTMLQWVFFFRNKARSYEAIQVEHGEIRFRVLEDLPAEDGRRVLSACGDLGWKVSMPVEPLQMNIDIDKRGWLVNPWRPDDAETHPKEQQ